MFHPNSKPQMCHDLTLQIISYQIKANMHNHGSIGLLRKLDFGGNLAFGCSGISLFCFSSLFSLVRCGTSADTKIWLVTKKVIASCIPRALTKLLLLLLFFSFCSQQFCMFVQTFSSQKKLFVLFFSFLLFSNL